MTVNEVKMWLNRGFYANQKIKALKQYIETSKQRITGVSVSYGNDGSSKSINAENGTENKIYIYLEIEEKINAEIAELENVSEEIRGEIAKLNDNDLESVLIHRYLNFHTHEQTAEIMGYSVESVKKKQKKAIEILKNLH